MARQPKSLPKTLAQLTFNQSTGLYDADEAGVVYHLTFEQMNQLKAFYTGSQCYPVTYENWYNHLDRFGRKQVKRSGNIPSEPTNFFPDDEPEYKFWFWMFLYFSEVKTKKAPKGSNYGSNANQHLEPAGG